MPKNGFTHTIGFSFIEVMISLVLMTLIFIGINAAHLVALHESKASYYYLLAAKQANLLANNLTQASPNEWQQISALFNRNIKQMLPNGHLIIEDKTKKRLVITWGEQSSVPCTYQFNNSSGCLIFPLSKFI